MREKKADRVPRARTQGLVVHELPDEVLVYDRDRDKAHCLNQTAALVWKYCDGRTTVRSMAQQLGRDLNAERVDEKVVWYALDQLGKGHLLDERVARPAILVGMNRREMLRVLGVTAVVAVPVVSSIIAPTPVQAGGSCQAAGQPCETPSQCCSGRCDSGLCA